MHVISFLLLCNCNTGSKAKNRSAGVELYLETLGQDFPLDIKSFTAENKFTSLVSASFCSSKVLTFDSN